MGNVNSRAVKVIQMAATVLNGCIRKFYSNFKFKFHAVFTVYYSADPF